MERIQEILQQIESRHLAKLWYFYRKHFPDDEDRHPSRGVFSDLKNQSNVITVSA